MKRREIWILIKTFIKSLTLAFVWTIFVGTSLFVVPWYQAIIFVIIPSFLFSIAIIVGMIHDWEKEKYDRDV
jgi:hypothetical protein